MLLADRYQIISALGRGAMGEVYRAEDLKLGETVALKFLPADVEHHPRRLAALLDEARLARRITHPNICRVHDVVETEDGLHFITMEYVDGEDLASLLRRIGRMPHAKALEVASECVRALAAAHEAGILHRDLKPANLMLDGAGRVRVTDFGLASAVGEHATGGTPAYMAPELFDGQNGSTQSDLYALGLVLYEVFTGQRAFQARSLKRFAMLHRTATPRSPREMAPEIGSDLDDLILRCLDKNPARRPALEALGDTIERLQQQSVDGASDPTPSSGDEEPKSYSIWRLSPFRLTASRSRRFVAGLLAIGGLVTWIVLQASFRDDTGPASERPRETNSVSNVVPSRPGLALLPLRDLTDDPETAWIGLAILEILFSELYADGHQRVVPLHRVDEALADLDLLDNRVYSAVDLKRLQRRLGVERFMLGSYSHITRELGGLLRVDLRLVEAGDGAVIATQGATGTETQLFDVVLRIGEALRGELAVEGLSPEQVLAIRQSLPSDPEAARAFVEGMDRMRRLDLNMALQQLTRAAEIEPDHPLPHAVLAKVWWKLGYEARARAAIVTAVDLAEALGTREQRELKARAAHYQNRLDDAVPLLEGLIRSFPDQLDYRGELIQIQLERGAYSEAQIVLARARDLPPPLGEHPILDYLAARIEERLGGYAEQRRLAESAAREAEQLGASNLAAMAYLQEASALQNLGDPEAEETAVERARALYEQLGDPFGTARCLQHLSNARYLRGDLDGSKLLLERARELYDEIGHDLNVASLSVTLANIEFHQGHPEGSIARLEQAAVLFRRVGNGDYVGRTLNNLGAFLQMRGRLQESLGRYRDALDVFTSLENRARTATTLNNIGEVQTFLGDLDGARTTLQEAQALARETGDRLSLGYATYRLAEVYRASGDVFVARSRYEESLAILAEVEDRMTAAEVRLGLARVALVEGDIDASERSADEVEQFFRSAGASDLRNLAEVVRTRAVARRGKLDAARRRVDALRLDVGPQSWPRVRYGLDLLEAQILTAEDRSDDALSLLAELVRDAGETGYLGFELEARVAMIEIEAARSGHEGIPASLSDLLEVVGARGFGALEARLRGLLDAEP